MLKVLVEKSLKLTFGLIARFYSYSLDKKIKKIRTIAYTYWVSSELKSAGENIRLNYPINIRGGKYISIGRKTGIGARGVLHAWSSYMKDVFLPEIKIGSNVWIGEDCHITSINKIEIGNDVLIGRKVTISDNSHGKTTFELLSIAPAKRPLFSKGPVIIEDNVWIGDKVTILSGVRVAKNAIIGANSVVTKDVDENCVVVGNPARVIKKICN